MKPLPNIYLQDWARGFASSLNGLDGELVVGDPRDPAACRHTVSAVMSIEGEPDFTFLAFDDWSMVEKFSFRFDQMEARELCERVEILDHFIIRSDADVMEFLEQAEAEGYEGVMLRSPNTVYKQGRATPTKQELLKVKSFSDAEAEVVAVHEEMHNGNEAKTSEIGLTERSHCKDAMVGKGTLGSLEVKNEKLWPGLTFNVGTGFDAVQRKEMWERRDQLIGLHAKFKYFPTGSKERPRFPVFLHFRDPIDM